MADSTKIGYHDLTRWRQECHERFGSILDMRTAASPWDFVQGDWEGRILDVGAGVAKSLKRNMGIEDERYFSLDSDPGGHFSYRTFADIPKEQNFDLVVMSQFIEHLSVGEGVAAVQAARDVLEPGGRLFISVPNAHHPVRYHADVTHLTNWPYNGLYGLLKECKFEVVEMGRSNKHPLPANPLKRWIVKTVCESIRIDWCDTLCVLARRPPA